MAPIENEQYSPKTTKELSSAAKALLIAVLIAAVVLLVYKTGGIKYVFSHTMYIPIILAAYFFQIPGGLITGIIAGIALGPFMPISVSTGEMQEVTNWIYRAFFFAGVGVLSGWLFSIVNSRSQRIAWMVRHSPDTGLANLNNLMDSLQQVKDKADPETKYALIAIRINNHAEVTSIFNIEETQALSVKYTRLIQCLLPFEGMRIYHFFPYTFFFFFPMVEYDETMVTDFILKNFHKLESPIQINRIPLFFKISIGVAIDKVKDIVPSTLFRKANWASHLADKQNLKYMIYETETDTQTRKTQQLLGDISSAANEDDFKLYYQPVIKLATGEVVGMEALLRWEHPEHGLLIPVDFLPYCENTTLVFLIHDWVLKTAIKKLSRWDEFKGSLSINLSTRLLLDKQWIDTLVKLLEAYQVDAHRLIFEVTESSLIVDKMKSIKTLNALVALGAKIAIDDFGTGYSSFEYINILPVHFLKIDKQFISAAENSQKSREIVKAIIQLADSLGIESVAEGVETKSQLEWLIMENCDYVQGYYLSRPLPDRKISTWMANSPSIK